MKMIVYEIKAELELEPEDSNDIIAEILELARTSGDAKIVNIKIKDKK